MTIVSFAELGLSEPILRALQARSYSSPTPIQARAIPALLHGRDLLGVAQTGTGKTAAFALPILDRLAAAARRPEPRAPRALVLVPTRELAAQVGASFQAYGRHLALSHAIVFGGVGQEPQVRALRRGVDTLIATPGRLLDLLDQGHLALGQVQILVLDEADRMLDMGFAPAVRRILAALPRKRQSILFSATMPDEVAKLAGSLLHDPLSVAVTPQATTVDRIEQRVYFVPKAAKRELLGAVLEDPALARTLVFTRTKHGADRVVKHLRKIEVDADAIHGDKTQSARQRALAGFRQGRTRVLVATDIAARGLDVPDVTHVINFDLPRDPEDYVHRIGRTARAGRDGIALSFCDGEERKQLAAIEKLIRRKVDVVVLPRLVPAPARPERTERPAPARVAGGTHRTPASREPARNGAPPGRPRRQRAGRRKGALVLRRRR